MNGYQLFWGMVRTPNRCRGLSPLNSALGKLTMSLHIRYEDNPFGVVVTCTGIITGEEIIKANKEVSKCKKCVYQLMDFTEVETINVSLEEIHKIAIQDNAIDEHYDLIKIALVGNISTLKQLLESYELFSGKWVGRKKPYETRLFNLVSEANDWINA